MKTQQIFTVAAAALSALLLVSGGRAAEVSPTGNGNWSSTVPDAPWPGGVLPATNDGVYFSSPYTITVDSNATCAYLDGDGTVTLAPGATLNVLGDPGGGLGAQTLQTLNATATGCTVDYKGNPFWAKRTDYYNLVFSGSGNFYNGTIPNSGPVPMNIAGDMTLSGTNVAVQEGADFNIIGNLSILGATNKWDCSSYNLTVHSNTFVTGTRALLVDLDGALGYNDFLGDVTIGSNAFAWNVSDVITWQVGGNLTNLALIAGKGYGSISFAGNGMITGKPISLPTITVSGTYLIGTTITLATNTPTLTGTLVFDLAKTNQIILKTYASNPLTFYYNGNLDVINSGAAPASGNTYKFFSATNFGGFFASTTLPTLPDGLSWQDDLLTAGSISVTGSALGSPTLALSKNNLTITLSWDSSAFPGYSVQARTNSAGIGNGGWAPTGSGTASPFITTVNPSGPPVFYRLVK